MSRSIRAAIADILERIARGIRPSGATAGNGSGGRRLNATGCHVVISGGTSRTIDVMVQ